MGKLVSIGTGHVEGQPENYPFEISQKIDKIEISFTEVVNNRLQLLEAKVLEYVKDKIKTRKSLGQDLKDVLTKKSFYFDLTVLITAILIGSKYSRDKIIDELGGLGTSVGDLKARVGIDLKMRPDEVMFVDLIGKRADFLAKVLQKVTLKKVESVIKDGLKRGLSIDDIAKNLEAVGAFTRSRAELIARTEIAFALNEGTREYLGSLGVKMFNVDIAGNACELCVKLQSEGPYTYEQAAGLLPRHPRCRCVWIAVIPKEWLLSNVDKSFKILLY